MFILEFASAKSSVFADDRMQANWLVPADRFRNVNTVAHYAATNRTYIWADWYTQGNYLLNCKVGI